MEADPPWFVDTAAARRERRSRNHVRLLLRGQGWQQREMKRQGVRDAWRLYNWGRGAAFFFPQRLWMAFALSVRIQSDPVTDPDPNLTLPLPLIPHRLPLPLP